MALPPLSLDFDPVTAVIPSIEGNNRWLSQLADCFADQLAYQTVLAQGDTLVYGVTNLDMEVAFGNWQQEDIMRFSDDYQRPSQGE